MIRARSPVETREATPEELSSLTEATSSTASAAVSEVSGKRKDRPKPSSSRFKMVGNVVLAMQRFQASLNPTITFGKGAASPGQVASSSSHDAIAPASQLSADANSLPSRNSDTSGAPKLRKLQSRNRFATMMQPLPASDDE